MEVIDENEWTDRNFGTESSDSEEDTYSSDESESESDSDYEEAAGSPLGAQTLQLASEWISDKRFTSMVDSDDDFYGYSSEGMNTFKASTLDKFHCMFSPQMTKRTRRPKAKNWLALVRCECRKSN